MNNEEPVKCRCICCGAEIKEHGKCWDCQERIDRINGLLTKIKEDEIAGGKDDK